VPVVQHFLLFQVRTFPRLVCHTSYVCNLLHFNAVISSNPPTSINGNRYDCISPIDPFAEWKTLSLQRLNQCMESRAWSAKDPHANHLIVIGGNHLRPQGKRTRFEQQFSLQLTPGDRSVFLRIERRPLFGRRWTSDCSHASWENHE
jgi:hypothetical protein